MAAVLGKLIIGVILAGIATGFVLRLKMKRRQQSEMRNRAVRPSAASRLVAAVLSVAEVAFLVEATNLPVRFDQPGFKVEHWYVVLIALGSAYLLQQPPIARLLAKRRTASAA